MKETSEITGYHAHVYFEPDTREAAASVRDGVAQRFTVELGRWHEGPVGPHTRAMYQIAFAVADFAAVVPWLMLNRSGLSILVHPLTGDEVADHDVHSLWLGDRLPIDLAFLRAATGT